MASKFYGVVESYEHFFSKSILEFSFAILHLFDQTRYQTFQKNQKFMAIKS